MVEFFCPSKLPQKTYYYWRRTTRKLDIHKIAKLNLIFKVLVSRVEKGKLNKGLSR